MAAHSGGIVTSTTLMVNYPAAVEAGHLAQEHERLGVGLHFQLTGGGRPALAAEQVRSLVDGQGLFRPIANGLSGADPKEALAEGRAQLKRFHELVGRAPTHFDSHHHVHKLPVGEEVLLTLAWETGLPVRGASAEGRARLAREGLRTTDTFIEDFYDEGASLERLLAILGSLELGTTELMCHPAQPDAELLATSGYAAARARELEILTHEEVRQTIQAAGIALVSFAAL